MDERKRHPGSVLAGILVGGLIGAGVALLTAPRSGEETRAMIQQKSAELKERSAGAIEQTRAKISEKAENMKGAFQEFKEGLKTSVEEPELLEQKPQEAVA
jgi:gas vesicle protein